MASGGAASAACVRASSCNDRLERPKRDEIDETRRAGWPKRLGSCRRCGPVRQACPPRRVRALSVRAIFERGFLGRRSAGHVERVIVLVGPQRHDLGRVIAEGCAGDRGLVRFLRFCRPVDAGCRVGTVLHSSSCLFGPGVDGVAPVVVAIDGNAPASVSETILAEAGLVFVLRRDGSLRAAKRFTCGGASAMRGGRPPRQRPFDGARHVEVTSAAGGVAATGPATAPAFPSDVPGAMRSGWIRLKPRKPRKFSSASKMGASAERHRREMRAVARRPANLDAAPYCARRARRRYVPPDRAPCRARHRRSCARRDPHSARRSFRPGPARPRRRRDPIRRPCETAGTRRRVRQAATP